jgi:hypothetical protein
MSGWPGVRLPVVGPPRPAPQEDGWSSLRAPGTPHTGRDVTDARHDRRSPRSDHDKPRRIAICGWAKAVLMASRPKARKVRKVVNELEVPKQFRVPAPKRRPGHPLSYTRMLPTNSASDLRLANRSSRSATTWACRTGKHSATTQYAHAFDVGRPEADRVSTPRARAFARRTAKSRV